MNAIEAQKRELKRIQLAQQECVNDSGYVISGYRYRYQMLVEKAQSFRESINWMEQLYRVSMVVLLLGVSMPCFAEQTQPSPISAHNKAIEIAYQEFKSKGYDVEIVEPKKYVELTPEQIASIKALQK